MFNMIEILGIIVFWGVLYLVHSRLSPNRKPDTFVPRYTLNKPNKFILDISFICASFLVLFLSFTKTVLAIEKESDFIELQIVGFGFLVMILFILALVRRKNV